MSAWSVKTRHAPSRHCRAPSRHCRDARVYGHATTAMNEIEYIPPIECTPPPSLPPPVPPFEKDKAKCFPTKNSALLPFPSARPPHQNFERVKQKGGLSELSAVVPSHPVLPEGLRRGQPVSRGKQRLIFAWKTVGREELPQPPVQPRSW